MAEAESHPDAREIVGRMMARDAFSQWLGIEVAEVAPGHSLLYMELRPEMCNGFGIAHGGIAYSLADSALAFAANGHGRMALSAKTSIAHLQQVRAGERLSAKCTEINAGHKLAHYHIEIRNAGEALVAHFEGTVYFSSKLWKDL